MNNTSGAKKPPAQKPPHLDHIIIATPDLAAGVAMIAEATGVTLQLGGVHPKFGTRNYLATFGDGTYLELIGVDTENPEFSGTRPFRVDEVTRTATSTWTIEPADIDAAVAAARDAGADLGDPFPGSRRTPEGTLLEWRLTQPLGEPSGVVPFLLDWQDSVTPAQTTEPRLELASITATHPDPEYVARVLEALGTHMDVTEGPAKVEVTLAGPSGQITL